MLDTLIPLLACCSVMALGSAYLTARKARRQLIEERLAGRDASSVSLYMTEHRSRFQLFLQRLGRLMVPDGPTDALRQELARAGYHDKNASTIYMGTKLSLMLFGLCLLSLWIIPMERFESSTRLLLILGGTAVMFLLPNYVVSRQRRKRQAEVRVHLADVIDLLEISVSSGMGLETAWNTVTEDVRGVSETLAEEMTLTNLEIHLGATRSNAMRHMAERTGASEIESLVSVLIQSDRFGTSIGDALRTFADSLREMRSQRAEELAEKMPIKLLFPLVLLLFPALLIVMCGPAGIRWAEVIGH